MDSFHLATTIEVPAANIYTLPPEVLSEILVQCMHPDNPPPFPRARDRRRINFPSQVSQSWRAIALSTPKLWSCIIIDFQAGITQELECAQIWLSRSGNYPLSISIGCGWGYPTDDDSKDRSLDLAMQLIMPHCKRWRHLKITSSSYFHDVFSSTSRDFPRLEVLELCFRMYSSRCSGAVETFVTAPRLHELNINQPPQLVNIQWNQLTHCEVTIVYAYKALCLSPGLLHLRLQGDVKAFDLRDEPYPITHPNLLHLDFSDNYRELAVDQFLEQITLPSLQELSTVAVYYSLAPMIARSACKIVKLKVGIQSDIDNSAAFFFPLLLQAMPGLRELSVELDGTQAWVAVKDTLELRDERQLVLGLRSCRLHIDDAREVVDPRSFNSRRNAVHGDPFGKQFIDLLLSRWTPPAHLSSSQAALSHRSIECVELKCTGYSADDAVKHAILQQLDTVAAESAIGGLVVEHSRVLGYSRAYEHLGAGFRIMVTVQDTRIQH
ncbi:hypothetical protein FIBSPDRAFT_183091 [Athelia psychrophila]|uniref:Uncharacterized protein n=1 Tax=Athelia psychrophila TaxID=1759441 RepID=A0A166AHK1_9AGAM|nr:hypothetical protein FIBSPDRAFT_183091 [Fibularhizoctonia sp. CBS 109695]